MTAAAKVAPAAEHEFGPDQFRAMAKDALNDANEADPRVVVDKLLEQLSDAECRVVLQSTLPNWIRVYAGQTSRDVRRVPKTSLSTPQRVNQWYSRILNTRLLAGEEWKFLRDCTATDLQLAADSRFKAADDTKREGAKYAHLAKLMKSLNAETVADVPAEHLKELFGDKS